MADRLGERGVLEAGEAGLLAQMAGYRNRLVHFYDRVSEAELHALCSGKLDDLERVLGALVVLPATPLPR